MHIEGVMGAKQLPKQIKQDVYRALEDCSTNATSVWEAAEAMLRTIKDAEARVEEHMLTVQDEKQLLVQTKQQLASFIELLNSSGVQQLLRAWRLDTLREMERMYVAAQESATKQLAQALAALSDLCISIIMGEDPPTRGTQITSMRITLYDCWALRERANSMQQALPIIRALIRLYHQELYTSTPADDEVLRSWLDATQAKLDITRVTVNSIERIVKKTRKLRYLLSTDRMVLTACMLIPTDERRDSHMAACINRILQQYSA
jgi:hypothetical protein